MSYRVGVCQFNPEFIDTSKNRHKMLEMVENVEADLIVFPELATSGYSFNNISEVGKVAESAEFGQTRKLFQKMSQEKDCSYVIGFAEKADGNFYNSSILVNPDGSFHVYRKTHLFLDEKDFFCPGDTGFRVFKAKNDVPVGMMICFDWIFPESAKSLMLNGASIIAHPANLVLPWCQQAMITRSLENRVFSITANRIGKERNGNKNNEFTGMSQVISEKGQILIRLSETTEEVQVISIDETNSQDKRITIKNDLLTDRRPDFYHS